MHLHRGFSLVEPTTNDPLAQAAVADIKDGMVVGLGTGKTSGRAILALAERVRAENLLVHCVPTSHVTETLARAHRLNVLDFAMVESVDYLFDGADEVDEQFQMLKGMQGAIARQRLVATVAKRRVYLIQEGKLTSRLGTKSTLPVVIMHFALSVIRAELRNLGLSGVLRRTMNGDLFLTDHGHLILDLMIGDREPFDVADALDHVPGVVDHGLFLDECDELLIENGAGEIRRLVRPEAD